MLFLLKDPFKTLLGSKQAVTAYDRAPPPSEFQDPGNIKSPITHTVTTVSFISFPAPCASRVICTTEASSAQPVPYSQPAPYPQLFLIPCHTHTLGCHIPMPREGGDKAYGRKNCTHTKNLRSSGKEEAQLAGSSSQTY